jgi:hypothetical protein
MNTTQRVGTQPEAHISIDKNRLQRFRGKVYLSDKAKFEIELFNPTQRRYGVKFLFNGEYMSNRHLIIDPGQRIFLDRFIETKKRFEFNTYEVDDSPAAKAAISKNGLIEVEFHQENDPIPLLNNTTNWPAQFTYTGDWFGFHGNTFDQYNTTISNSGGISENTTVNYCSTNLNQSPKKNARHKLMRSMAAPEPIETGRINKSNENSNQEFQSVEADFNWIVDTKVVLQLLPISLQPANQRDLVQYCPVDGTKFKKGYNFCPKCGKAKD